MLISFPIQQTHTVTTMHSSASGTPMPEFIRECEVGIPDSLKCFSYFLLPLFRSLSFQILFHTYKLEGKKHTF